MPQYQLNSRLKTILSFCSKFTHNQYAREFNEHFVQYEIAQLKVTFNLKLEFHLHTKWAQMQPDLIIKGYFP